MNFIRIQFAAFLAFLCGISLVEVAKAQDITFKNCKKCIVLAEQSVNRVAILDLDKKKIVWEWLPEQSPEIKPEHVTWFKNPSDAKVVYNGCILTNASGGGVAFIRIADKKVLWYAYAGGNPHSSEMLFDGTIVTASSTGNLLTIFRLDKHFPGADNVYRKTMYLEFGHNVVWDKKRNLLWSATQNQLKTFKYNNNREQPDFVLNDSIPLPEKGAHDLFPVYNEQALWLTTEKAAYKYDVINKKLEKVALPWHNVKSISSGPAGFPNIAIIPDGTPGSWWTDEIKSFDGQTIFKQPGLKIYKARWFLDNPFSYYYSKYERLEK